MNRSHHSYWDLAVDTVYPSAAAFDRLRAAKKARIYLGIDPTRSVIHLGFAVPLRLLKLLQDEGHQVIVLVGSFTALIGDPSGRDQTRPQLTEVEIQANTKHYREQIGRILDPQKTIFEDNASWFTKGTSSTVGSFLGLAQHFTAAQLWERDMFQERQKKGSPVTLTEFVYPVIQAYDFVALNADVQIGGTDQTFNMLAGRDLSKKLNQGEKFVLTTRLLRGTDGRKMSKSYDNTITLDDAPGEMYGKLMSIPDALLPEYFALAAGIDPEDRIIRSLIETDPRAAKARMAFEVTSFYHGIEQGDLAQREFDATFRDGARPTDIPEKTPSTATAERLTFYLVDLGLATSRAEAARLVGQGGVKVDNALISDQFASITPHDGMIIQVGKRKFVRVKL